MNIKVVCNGKTYGSFDCFSDSHGGIFLPPAFGECLNSVLGDYRGSEDLFVVLRFHRSVSAGVIAFDFALDNAPINLGPASIGNELVLFEFKYGKEMIEKLYDLLVYLTTNYSQMPEDFRARFSEGECVQMRQSLFNSLNS